MSYILFKVKRKLVYHRKIYSLLLLEITVAVACIVFAFQYYFYGMEESEKTATAFKNKELVLQITQTDMQGPSFRPDSEDISRIRQMSGGKINCTTAAFLVTFSGEDALEYAYILSDQKSSGSAYVGSRVRQWIREEKIPDVEEAEGGICIRGTWFQLEEVFSDHVLPLDCFDQPLETENSIILSAEELPVIGEEANVQCIMTIGNQKENGSVAEELLQYLNEKYGEEYSFYFSNQQYEKEYLVEYLSLIPGYLGKVAVILIFIMSVGYAGILKLFFLKRMSELAICSACGASYKSLVKEVILEIGAICLGGCVIGMGAGTILTETVELGLPVRPDIRSYLIALGLALAMAFLQSGLVLLPLKKDSIYAALRETGK